MSANEYYVIYENDKWKFVVPESETSSDGKTVLRTFKTKKEAMEYGKKKAKDRNARLVENARKGYTMSHYDYS